MQILYGIVTFEREKEGETIRAQEVFWQMLNGPPIVLERVQPSTCAICGAKTTLAWPTVLSSKFTDIDVLWTSRFLLRKGEVICPACGAIMRSDDPNPRKVPLGSVGYFITEHAFLPISPGLAGLKELSEPPEVPFVAVLGRWNHERHVLLRAQVAWDRRVYPALTAPLSSKAPFHLMTFWISAEKTTELIAQLTELEQKGLKPFQVARKRVKRTQTALLEEFWRRFDYPWTSYLLEIASLSPKENTEGEKDT